jgi:hypothetical protein
MRTVKSCSELGNGKLTEFKLGELYRIFDTTDSSRSAIAIAVQSGGPGNAVGAFVIDKGNSSWVVGTISLSQAFKPVHLPNAVIVTNE